MKEFPTSQRMVVSLSSDKAVWDAVLNNEAVREIRDSYRNGQYASLLLDNCFCQLRTPIFALTYLMITWNIRNLCVLCDQILHFTVWDSWIFHSIILWFMCSCWNLSTKLWWETWSLQGKFKYTKVDIWKYEDEIVGCHREYFRVCGWYI